MRRARRAPAVLRDNAFAVLEVELTATRREVEASARKTLAQLELGIPSARQFTCPATGEFRERDEELLRDCLRRLRDPQSRAREELHWLIADAWRSGA